MTDQPQQMPTAPVQEGSRWRYHRPSADEVAAWFATQKLDEGMDHADYVSGVVLIPESEKVTRQLNERGTEEVYEMVYTPYVRVDTRVKYFHKLAALRDSIAVIKPACVPEVLEGALANGHLPDGFFWFAMGAGDQARRFICARWMVALYDRRDYLAVDSESCSAPWLAGSGTKQAWGDPDVDALAKVETGAIGRALGVAGILVIGTGIATAEDMQEYRQNPGSAALAALPVAGAPEQTSEQLNEHLLALQGILKPYEEQWRTFAAWWGERSKAEGWTTLSDASIEVRRGMVHKMEDLIGEAQTAAAPEDSNPDSAPEGA